MVNVVVTKPRNVKVSTNATAGIINTSTPVTLKNTPTLISGNNLALENLLDVSVVSKTNGSFTISSGHNGDTDVVGWFIINNS